MMKVVIIEDEALAAKHLRGMILEIQPQTDIMAILDSVQDSTKWLKTHAPDLIFLDIQLADGNSFEIFEEIDVVVPIIFTTAYDQYAIKAFKLNSIDYLLKPIRQDALRASLEKYSKLHQAVQPDISGLLQTLQQQHKQYKQRFLLHFGETLRKVETLDVAYFYAQDKGVYLVTFRAQTLPMDHSLSQLEEILDPDKFFRINRQMIINEKSIEKMHAYSRSRIKIDLTPSAPKGIKALVSIDRTPVFKDWIDQ